MDFHYQRETFQFLLICLATYVISVAAHSDKPLVLLVSFDGFRWDYLKKTETPYFDQIIKSGVTARNGIKNAFITKTFPNHYTIVTGLYEESHGIVGNVMFDPKFNETFNVRDSDSKWFDNGGEPIWVTNQRQCTCRRSGIMFWPGEAASVEGILPYKYKIYDETYPNKSRINTIVEWFTDEYPINLGLLYFSEPDKIGHEFGPDSPHIADMIKALDGLVGYLLEKLKDAGLLNDINIVITSDHGMASTPANKTIDLDKYIDPTSYRIFSENPIGSILPNAGKEQEIYDKLQKIENLKVYKKEDIPDRFHYKHNRRIMPLLLVPEEGYSLRHNGSYVPNGNHGYDNSLSDMHPFFIAMGPAFKQGHSIDTFDMVDIYPLLCHILKLKPAPNNGSLDKVHEFLKEKPPDNSTFLIYIIILIFITTVTGIFSVAACRQHRYHKRQTYMLHALPMISSEIHYKKTTVNGGQVPLLHNTVSDSEEEF